MMLGDLIVKIKKFGLENVFRKYYSIYPAIVIDNKDEKKRGRVLLKVPDIMGDAELANWAEPILLSAGKSEEGKFGIFYPPKIGDYVWAQFRMGDISAPLYMGGWWGKDEMPDYLTDDKKNAIFISRYGHKIVFDETKENANFKIEMNEGTFFEINSGKKYIKLLDKNGNGFSIDLEKKEWMTNFEGKLIETIKNEVNKTFDNKLTVKVSADGEISCGGKVVVKGSGKGSFFGSETHLGAESGSYAVPLGEMLLQSINTFITMYNSHMHNAPQAPAGVLPTTPPVPTGTPIQNSVLSQKVKLV